MLRVFIHVIENQRVYVWCRMEPELYFDFSPQQHTKELLASADATHATYVVDYVLTFDAYLQALNSILGRSFSQVTAHGAFTPSSQWLTHPGALLTVHS
jgi:hypothetical protein